MRNNAKHQQLDREEQSSNEQKAFVFRGGNLALDLVNTEVMARGKRTDLLRTPQDACQWWEMARQAHPQATREVNPVEWDEQQLLALYSLRRSLRDLFELVAAQHQVNNHHVKILNAFLREGYYSLEVSPEGNLYATYQPRQDEGTTAVLPIAFAALRLLTEQDLSRLHACQNDQCILLFYDTTRSATRHWCSIACTNRARSRQNYRQAKERISQFGI
ncbi:MAG TPA: ABATE domain-containing protein [Ktedonobacteraceae bacterium]|nr:ABATE domain-containing protein [Ktedonobacteraceae bacterium]